MPRPANVGLAEFLEMDLATRAVKILWGTAQEFTDEFYKRRNVVNFYVFGSNSRCSNDRSWLRPCENTFRPNNDGQESSEDRQRRLR